MSSPSSGWTEQTCEDDILLYMPRLRLPCYRQCARMAASERKRPWYLLLSLLAALVFGANAAHSGWTTVMLYRERIDPAMAGQGIADEGERAAVVARADGYVQTLDAAKARGWPLGVASLILGLATLFFSIRALGGSGGARAALVQLLLVQAAVNAGGYWLLRDVRYAELRWLEARHVADGHEHVPEDMLQAVASVALAMQLFGTALMVIGLTRRRSRDFFDSAAAAVGER